MILGKGLVLVTFLRLDVIKEMALPSIWEFDAKNEIITSVTD